MPHYLVSVGDKEYDVEIERRGDDYEVSMNGNRINIRSHRLGETRLLLLIDGRAHEVDVRTDGYGEQRTVFMRGMEIPVDIEDFNLAQLRKTAGMASGPSMEKTLRAPMPGLVLELKVAPGDSVTKGQPLLVVEAMKMENIIKAVGSGTVKTVHVASGASVEKGDKLLEFE